MTVTQIAPAAGDIFVKSAPSEFQIQKNNLYEKTLSNLGIFTKESVKNIVENIVKKTGAEESLVYKTLGKITAYSSFKSLDKIQRCLKENGSPVVVKQTISSEPDFVKKNSICLSDALSYILNRNYSLDNAGNKQTCVILDSTLLDYIESLPKENRSDFISQNADKLIYLENFEEGYNFLNRGASLENFAINYMTSKTNTTEQRAKDLGLNFVTVKNELPENITPDLIAKNLNPIYPTKEKFSKIIDSMLKSGLNEAETEENKKYLIKFLDKMLFPISPEKYAQYMQVIKLNIDKFMEQNNKNPKNVYYIIPDYKKSFITTNYQYTRANNLEASKYIFPDYNDWFEKEYKIKNLPDNSTIVVLDDCIITGLTLAKEVFNYRSVLDDIKSSKKNISIILASAVGTKSGLYNLKNMLKQHGRENKDAVFSGVVLPQWKLTSSNADEKFFDIEDMPNKYTTVMTLPYMAPDTNLGISRPLLQNFLYSKNAQKSNYPHFNSIFFG